MTSEAFIENLLSAAWELCRYPAIAGELEDVTNITNTLVVQRLDLRPDLGLVKAT